MAQEDMSSCGTRRRVFLCHKKMFLVVLQEGSSSYATRRGLFMGHKSNLLLVPKEETFSSCGIIVELIKKHTLFVRP